MILYDKEHNSFRLDTPSSTYCISICNGGYIGHAYYGSKLGKDDVSYLTRSKEYGFSDSPIFREKHSFLDFFPQELPTDGLGDFRQSALAISDSKGHNGVELKYKAHKIYEGAATIKGLPAVFGDKNDCSRLEITAADEILGLEVTLIYTVFEKIDAIVRSTRVKNCSKEPVYIKKCLSAAFDMDDDNFDMITLHGSWARERHQDRRAIHMGKQGVLSMRGESSHQEHPFLAVLDHNADFNNGRVWGLNFIYSGNFIADIQKSQFDSLRLVMGINPENFCWKLNPQESFDSPQAALVYSDCGLNGMSRTFHDLYRDHLIRSPYKKSSRPVLINNWEATYFNFDTDKLLDIAREAAKDGIEMLVMDDGWFGKRNSDNCSLGDWVVNEEKIKGGLKHLVDEVN
ncbi:MAG: alpha-galactosidase, partial [Treponema sp.]|nr:alpha-galactosidase [Treponema sp.]